MIFMKNKYTYIGLGSIGARYVEQFIHNFLMKYIFLIKKNK